MSMDQDFERVPDAVKTKQRRSALRRVINSLAGWSLLVILGCVAVLGYGWSKFTAQGPLTENKTVIVPEGAGRTQVSRLLQDEGVISDARVMNGAALGFSLAGSHLKPGEYEFPSGATMASVFDIISKGRVVTYKLTVPEGWTTQMALARVNENAVLGGDPVQLTGLPEGSLVADTIVFRRGKTKQQMVDEMKAAQEKVLEEVWAKKPADFMLRSKEELLILASIVEKETGKPEERPRVAAVFLNRLRKGMRLQSDPTIIYGIAGGAGRLDRPLTKADIATPTLYNTYQIDGLPPGPIASPGRASLEAVIAPAQSNDLYFVADGTGGHAFAETLEQHNANVQKWRDLEKNGILLPDDGSEPATQNAQAETTPATTVEQPALPTPEVSSAQQPAPATAGEAPAVAAGEPASAPAVDEAAVETAAQTQAASQPVPQPTERPEAVVETKPKPATPPPLPVEKKPKPVAAEVAQAEVVPTVETVKFEPGSIVKVDGKSVPVPKLKQKKR
jgi:UPF0755 protein